MRRWNGWGDLSVNAELPAKGREILKELIGDGIPREDIPLERILEGMPASNMPSNPIVSEDRRIRLDHAHGQSMPDWIGLRCGSLNKFPDGVAFPSAVEELDDLLYFAEKNGIVVVPYGGGTSVTGHLTIPDTPRPVLSLSLRRLNRLTEIDPASLLATFEAGVLGPELEARLRVKGFTLGHFPQSFEYSSLGGWIMTRSSGQQSLYYGKIENLFAGGRLHTPKGIMNLPPFPASAAGPDLRHLVLGAEGRLGVLSKAIVRISPLPERDDVYGYFFPLWESGVEAVRELAVSRLPLSMIRLSNPLETFTSLALSGHESKTNLLAGYLNLRGAREKEACMCLVGFIGSDRLVTAARKEVKAILKRFNAVYVGKVMGEAWKKNRFRMPYLRNSLWESGYAVDTFETALTWGKVLPAVKSIEERTRGALADYDEKIHIFTHLSHLYATGSSIYTTLVFRTPKTAEEMLRRWQILKKAASLAVVAAGGTISHHHGVGFDHKEYMDAEKGPVGMSIVKNTFDHIDPDRRMNPDKLI
ncbi:MAG: FAD-binding oxidoreductase [Desulfobacteraceae bacterium]|nr:MAG: FAD-binding oxidoreductase [Desulfobacteraceae bacterium]